jgi:hypothetical protein
MVGKNRMVQKRGVDASTASRRQIISLLNARRERKYFGDIDTGTLTVAGGIARITQRIIQGDSSSTRDGAQIEMFMLKLHYNFRLGGATAGQARLIVFSDTQNAGTTPAVTDVLSTASPSSSYTRDVEIVKRYHILYDSIVGQTPSSATASIVRYVKLKPKYIVSYNGTTDAATANGKNAMFAILIADNTSTQFSVSYAVMYYDS